LSNLLCVLCKPQRSVLFNITNCRL